MAYTKPVPVPDERSEGYWEAAKQHALAVQRCQHCSHYSHPPVVVCPRCQNGEPSFKFQPVSGRGRLKTWTIMRDSFLPGFAEDLPFVIGVVELDEQVGIRMVARILDGPEAGLQLDAPVRVVYEDATPEVTLPQFELVP